MRSRLLAVGAAAAWVVLTFGASSADAQSPGQAVDVQRVLHTVADALGILRDVQERDALMTVEYIGAGTMNEAGRSFMVTNYRGSIAFDFPGMRVDLTRTDGGTPERQIEVVSDSFAWNEIGEAGGGLDPTVGGAVPARNTVDDRLLRMWMTPFGAIKAARVAKDPNVTVENGVVVITFTLNGPAHPGPSTKVVVGGLAGTSVKMTLDSDNRPAKVEVRRGSTMLETIYAEYADLNPTGYKADIFFPAKITHKIGGQVVLDLTIKETNTYNPYVILPVPANVQKARN